VKCPVPHCPKVYRYPKALSTHLVSCHASSFSELDTAARNVGELFQQAVERELAFFKEDHPAADVSASSRATDIEHLFTCHVIHVKQPEEEMEEKELAQEPGPPPELQAFTNSRDSEEEEDKEQGLEEKERIEDSSEDEEVSDDLESSDEDLEDLEQDEKGSKDLEEECSEEENDSEEEDSPYGNYEEVVEVIEEDEIEEVYTNLKGFRVVLFDTETTGGSKDDVVIELSLLDIMSGKLFER